MPGKKRSRSEDGETDSSASASASSSDVTSKKQRREEPSDASNRSNGAPSSSLSLSSSSSSSSSSAAAAASATDNWHFINDKGRRKKIYKGSHNYEVQLQNIVATTDLSCVLNLETIQHSVRNAEYNPSKFSACVIRIREPRTTALVFESGKMVVTGAGCWEDAKKASIKFAKAIRKLGFTVSLTEENLNLSNIVASCDVKFAIQLEALAGMHGTSANYEPELFPGLIYRMQDPKVVLLIFVSGKVVMTGAKRIEDILKAFEMIYPVLYMFKKAGSSGGSSIGADIMPQSGASVGAGQVSGTGAGSIALTSI